MRDLRIGVIGYGARGPLAREAHRQGAGAEVVAVCDPSARARDEAGTAFPDALITADLGELLDHGVDAVMVLTPDDRHAGPVLAALEAGVAVFCEKPLAVRIEDTDRILATARRTGARLYVGHNMRHMPVITVMKELIDDGRIGEVKAIWCRHFVGHGGDYYFKDWHADRSRSTSLLLQKGAHDIDVIHWLAGGYSRRVAAVGALSVYGDVTDRADRSDERMTDWFSLDNWPPSAQRGLHPIIDVEDLSMMNMVLDGGVLASYQQCHFTPDYWRNYTVIGTQGRIENTGDAAGARVHLWNRRHNGTGEPDESVEVPAGIGGHGGADSMLISEFLRFVRDGGRTETSPVAAREAVAAGIVATASLRGDGSALPVPPLEEDLVAYFDAGQPGSGQAH
ncbi:Gfo/Idh/MocA family protein [Occultella gossypii]|uniref:Gfo/Idh/MocA family oxidoreductase n=1 Tax=Occultella gossypii TaxID=2800820 RepID=A0ABS7SDI2_9MICO|nr:Gfo/Idh/MocA family oxidoreductase [Occultella gossypii]MBZ2197815.1 Gfo/Idh/MocA family oxidoreductase [Occultella gossypii]